LPACGPGTTVYFEMAKSNQETKAIAINLNDAVRR
jgi:hypothetical protein